MVKIQLALLALASALAACDLSLNGAQISCSAGCPPGWTCGAGNLCIAPTGGGSGGSSGATTLPGSSSGTTGSLSTGGSTGSNSTGGSTGRSTAGTSGATPGTSTGGSSSGGSTGAPAPSFSALSLYAGTPGANGNADGVGAAARFDAPRGITADDGGNLYVADLENHAVREIKVATGAVTTLAGQTDGGGGNVDGVGLNAVLDQPTGVLWDGTGNLYVADGNQCTIRKIAIASQQVTTIAGDAGACIDQDSPSPTQLHAPIGLAYDGANLYIAENGGMGGVGNRIRMFDTTSGALTTIAGTGQQGSQDGSGASATFKFPLWLAYGPGELVVADEDNNLLRQIELPGYTVNTLAGNGTPGFANGPPLTSAELTQPHGVAFDSNNFLYVADWTQTIRVGGLMSLSTVAGNEGVTGSANGLGTAAEFNSPVGIAIVGPKLYVAEQGNDDVRAIALDAGAAVTTLAGLANASGFANGSAPTSTFRGPRGLAFDGVHTLYVADSANNLIRAVNVQTNVVSTLTGTPAPDPTTPDAGSTDGTLASATFDDPWDVAYDATDAGYLYVSDNGSNAIRRIDLGLGVVTTPVLTTTGPALNSPRGLALDGKGNLYVADSANNEIRQIALSTGTMTTLAGSTSSGSMDGTGVGAGFWNPSGVTFDGLGNLYVSDTTNHTVRKITLPGAVVSTVGGVAGSHGAPPFLSNPQELLYDNGYLFVSGDETVRLVDLAAPAATAVEPLIGIPWQQSMQVGPLPGVLSNVHGLALTHQGLYIVDANENVIVLAH